mmetsp:Transcript_97853/g.315787  ORF Transcript_97853/g.315787 Transcript_97853/m.315787 type:complete len:195 (+) Transcript_97853:98-682(+)
MLLPMPPMPVQSGPPCEYVMSRRWLLFSMLLAQSLVCVLRMVLLLDILGGFIMAICIGFGWYGYQSGMDITFICYWGMMCLINGAFDLVKLIDHWVKAPVPLFSSHLPPMYNAMSATLLAVPLVTLPGAWLAWHMYKGHSEADSPGDFGAGIYFQGRHAQAERGDSSERQRLLPGSSSRSFQAFAGSGQRLGAC